MKHENEKWLDSKREGKLTETRGDEEDEGKDRMNERDELKKMDELKEMIELHEEIMSLKWMRQAYVL